MKPMELRIPAGDTVLDGEVGISEPVHGVVVFAHSSGSSRHSPRNQFVAERLRDAGLATVLVDLLTPDEERNDATTDALPKSIGYRHAPKGDTDQPGDDENTLGPHHHAEARGVSQ